MISVIWFIAIEGVTLFVLALTYGYMSREIGRAYARGHATGYNKSQHEAVNRAVEDYKASLQRKLYDGNRVNPARSTAGPAKVHRIRMAPRKPQDHDK